MTRIVTGLLVAGMAGVLGWWANQRGIASRQATAMATTEPTSQPAPSGQGNVDDKMIVVPPGDIDPKMVKTMPDVDPKMIITPPWPPQPRLDTSDTQGQ